MAVVILQKEDINLFTNDVELQRDLVLTHLSEYADLAVLSFDLRYRENKDESTFIQLATQLEKMMGNLEPYMEFS